MYSLSHNEVISTIDGDSRALTIRISIGVDTNIVEDGVVSRKKVEDAVVSRKYGGLSAENDGEKGGDLDELHVE